MSLAISVQNVSKLYRLGEISRGQLLADIHRWWMKRGARKTDTRRSCRGYRAQGKRRLLGSEGHFL